MRYRLLGKNLDAIIAEANKGCCNDPEPCPACTASAIRAAWYYGSLHWRVAVGALALATLILVVLR